MICETKSNILPCINKVSFSDGNACVVDFSKKQMDAARRESCGKCVLCREGTWQVYEILKGITEGKAEGEDLELAKELLYLISTNAGCEMSVTAATRCLELIEEYKDEWDLHIRRKRCTNLICKVGFTLYVAPDLCNGCGKCLEICPKQAIDGGNEMIHLIDIEKCDKCMLCVDICPEMAIKKYGGLRPKLPTEPLAVGSFGTSSGDDEDRSNVRRRRRGE